MEFRLFDKPDYKAGRPGDAAWYKDRAVSDHINEPGHRERLLQAVELIQDICSSEDISTLSDLGAGNGGLLNELKVECGDLTTWGYDMSPLAVKWGVEKYGVNLANEDVVEAGGRYGDIVVMTEFLEHLVQPHEMVWDIFHRKTVLQEAQFIVASVPGFEDPRNPYIYHLWAWHGSSFADLFTRIGWKVQRHFFRGDCGTQFLVASR
jgi:hypothetical protein